MAYTLGEAAKATGRSKTSIKRALEKGRISGVKSEAGEWQIEPVELHRVYPQVEHGTVTPGTPEVTGGLHTRAALAEREVELLRVQLEREREISRGLEQDRDHWRAQATGLLAAPPVPTSPAAPGRLRQAWRALLGRKG